MNVGFIGVGYMGYGIAKNILKKGNNLFVIANKKREPIDKIVSDGAKEVKSYNELCEKNLDALFLCVTNTPIAISIAEKVCTLLTDNTLIIDVTTHNQNGSINMEKIFANRKINYIECPVMGGPVQAEEGVCGGIVGGSNENFKKAEIYLKTFCKDYFHFGEVGKGAKSKLLNNFLSLGTATNVIEFIKSAKKLDIDLEKLFAVAKLGSGNSTALNRIFDNVLKDDYTGFKFSTSNTLKDLTYIHEMLKDLGNAEKLADVKKSIYKKAVDDGNGDLFISELIQKD
ncbi:NAD(P)-dependent oxidoreductase [Candidatus Pelagibacter sp.]|nr:NAD(P)-dependent oxidoreductase [Candidatus Pelagibacter sp.]